MLANQLLVLETGQVSQRPLAQLATFDQEAELAAKGNS
jgi:hypothetical protein